ncbi:MAG TPA: hypothetical protein VL651_11650 [Bacteroidia bacterium]|jgi:hypothetical protein|nr:hypothetical protein [Bacteroidia bacterium]
MKVALIICSLFLFASCQKASRASGDNKNSFADSADYIFMYFNHSDCISLKKNCDSVFISTQVADSTSKSGYAYYHYKQIRVIGSRVIRDSLFFFADKLIRNPSRSEKTGASDYTGNYLSIVMINGATKASIEFENVDDWTLATKGTEELFDFLHRNQIK